MVNVISEKRKKKKILSQSGRGGKTEIKSVENWVKGGEWGERGRGWGGRDWEKDRTEVSRRAIRRARGGRKGGGMGRRSESL